MNGQPSIAEVQRERQSRKRCRGNREVFGRSWRSDGERAGRWRERSVIKAESDNEDVRGLLGRGVPWQ